MVVELIPGACDTGLSLARACCMYDESWWLPEFGEEEEGYGGIWKDLVGAARVMTGRGPGEDAAMSGVSSAVESSQVRVTCVLLRTVRGAEAWS